MSSFSERLGLRLPKQIQFRDDLPADLRIAFFRLVLAAMDVVNTRCAAFRNRATVPPWNDCGTSLWALILRRFNPYGTERLPFPVSMPLEEEEERNPEIGAGKGFFIACPWNWLYDVLEDAAERLRSFDNYIEHYSRPQDLGSHFENAINGFFAHEGIGWKLDQAGKVVLRTESALEVTLTAAIFKLKEEKKPTAAEHLTFAFDALSARPKSNTSGAVSHATCAVECVLGDITGETMTLGKYLDRSPGLFHAALKKGIDGVYGFASDQARHGREGREPTSEDAEFCVATCAAVCTLLIRKHSK